MTGKDLLLEAASSPENITAVPIPEIPRLDGKIFVRVLTAGERHLYAEAGIKAQTSGGFISDYEIVAISACESDGTPMFHKRDAEGRLKVNSEDIAKLINVDGRAISAIAKKALEVSGLDFGATDRAKKDSASGPSDASSSDSPPSSDEASKNS
jgi:hypothetical protein